MSSAQTNFVYITKKWVGWLCVACNVFFFMHQKSRSSRRDSRWRISLIRSPAFRVLYHPLRLRCLIIIYIIPSTALSTWKTFRCANVKKLELIKLNEFNLYSNKLITTTQPLGIETRLARRFERTATCITCKCVLRSGTL